MTYTAAVQERFWAKVDRTDGPAACWLWTGARIGDGYGNLRVGDHTELAHRIAFVLCRGPIPLGLGLDHLCRTRLCVNPAHLDPVTARENTYRSPIAIAVINAAKQHCPRGHVYDTTWAEARGRSRRCRTCERHRAARRRAAA